MCQTTKSEHLCQRGINLEGLSECASALRTDAIDVQIELWQGSVRMRLGDTASRGQWVERGTKSKHLCQRGADTQGLGDRADALGSVGAVTVVIQTAQLVIREIKLQ